MNLAAIQRPPDKDRLTVKGPVLLCFRLGWGPTSNLGSKPSLFRPSLHRKFWFLLLRPESTSSILPWDPQETPLRTLCPFCVSLSELPVASVLTWSELYLILEQVPRLAQHSSGGGRGEAMCICGSKLERKEPSLSFLGMGLAGNHF